ncbi:threonine-phosphate decarboxylase CobD [Craterilacuibacter sp.]|uniref:threonine-phosphate decarboxylase CobD n=1 Tax=Craterilacuibacter sp. TaxID=2870909 RepID=UPI003F4030BC
MSRIVHGGNLKAAIARFGGDNWLDLSAGLSPHAYPLPALNDDVWQRLPEDDPALLAAACAYYAAPQMLAVAGTQAAIQALPRLRAPCRVSFAAPGYAEHPACWRAAGHAVQEIAYSTLETQIAHSDVVIVCNPNNPTGQHIEPATLLRWAECLAARGGWLVVDEAFGDMLPARSVAAHTAQPGLIVLRSVGKFFGLAGLRLGFVAAEAALLERLCALLGPWSVSGPAQIIGRAALADHDWQAGMRMRLEADGQRLRALLLQHGINSQGTALFRWWPDKEAEHFHQHMAQQQIWVRLFPQAARGIRLGLPPNEESWQRLATALADAPLPRHSEAQS